MRAMIKLLLRLWLVGITVLLSLFVIGETLSLIYDGPGGYWTDSVSRKPLVVEIAEEGSLLSYFEEFDKKRWWSAAGFQNPACVTEGVCFSVRSNPYEGDWGRLLKSLSDRKLRPENGIFQLLVGGELRYLFPGHSLVPSPDHQYVAFLRSAGSSGAHSLHILDVATLGVTTLAGITEGDPGSGISFDYLWSADSRALGLAGWFYGKLDVKLVYTLDSQCFWERKTIGTSRGQE